MRMYFSCQYLITKVLKLQFIYIERKIPKPAIIVKKKMKITIFFLCSLFSISWALALRTFISTFLDLKLSVFKGFSAMLTSFGVSMLEMFSAKPLKTEKIKSNRVDINVLKSKLQETESREFKKNVYILSSLVLGLGALGIYLSL